MLDIKDKKFNSLTAIKYHHSENNKQFWEFKCDCGKTAILEKIGVVYGRIKNCHDKRLGARNIDLPKNIKDRLIRIRNGIINRCERKYSTGYKSYGEKGIHVCDEWRNTTDGLYNFINWAISSGYNNTLTIDRIDNEKGYYPENCRWATYREQGKNKRNTIIVKYKGKNMCISELADILGCSRIAIFKKIKQNKPIELTKRGRKPKKY